jgi:colicin import membrane protein
MTRAHPAPDTFSRNVAISLGAHFVVAMLIFFKTAMMPSEPIELRRAIRVDVVGLPQKMPKTVELAPPAPQPAAPAKPSKPEPPVKELPKKAEVKPEPKGPTVNLDKKKPVDRTKAQNKALDKIKQMSAIDKLKEDLANEKKAAAKAAVIAGNKVSEGNSLTGMERIDFERYGDDVRKRINSNWNIDQWLKEGNFKAQVQILVDSNGTIVKKIMRRSSGNDIFDAQVLQAIDASSPLPVPPDRIRAAVSMGGILMSFPE